MARSIFSFPRVTASAESFADALGMNRQVFQDLAREFRQENSPGALGGNSVPDPGFGKMFKDEQWPMAMWLVDRVNQGQTTAPVSPAFKKQKTPGGVRG